MSKVDWYYHRPGCTTCGKSQSFLNQQKIDVKETVNAAKVRFEPDEALAVARQAGRIVVAKGKKVVTFDMKRDPPDDETLLKYILGPSWQIAGAGDSSWLDLVDRLRRVGIFARAGGGEVNSHRGSLPWTSRERWRW